MFLAMLDVLVDLNVAVLVSGLLRGRLVHPLPAFGWRVELFGLVLLQALPGSVSSLCEFES